MYVTRSVTTDESIDLVCAMHEYLMKYLIAECILQWQQGEFLRF